MTAARRASSITRPAKKRSSSSTAPAMSISAKAAANRRWSYQGRLDRGRRPDLYRRRPQRVARSTRWWWAATISRPRSAALSPTTIPAAAPPGLANFEKEGTGTLILSGANLYTGTTAVTGGVLPGRRLDRLVDPDDREGGGTFQRHRFRRQHHGRRWRYLCAGQRRGRQLHDGIEQSRIPVRRAIPGAGKFDDFDVCQGDRHGCLERSVGVSLRRAATCSSNIPS